MYGGACICICPESKSQVTKELDRRRESIALVRLRDVAHINIQKERGKTKEKAKEKENKKGAPLVHLYIYVVSATNCVDTCVIMAMH